MSKIIKRTKKIVDADTGGIDVTLLNDLKTKLDHQDTNISDIKRVLGELEGKLDNQNTNIGNIKTVLEQIARKLHKQDKFTWYVFIFGTGLATIGLGAAIRSDNPGEGLFLMVIGLALLLITSLWSVFYNRK